MSATGMPPAEAAASFAAFKAAADARTAQNPAAVLKKGDRVVDTVYGLGQGTVAQKRGRRLDVEFDTDPGNYYSYTPQQLRKI